MSEKSIKFATHREPVWRPRANFIVNAIIPDEDESQVQMEQLWVKKLTDDKFEMCCIPFFLYDIALGDVVSTRPQLGRRYVVDRAVAESGRYVFRVWFGESDNPPRDEVAIRLEEMGSLLEWSSLNLLAVDTAGLPHAQMVADYLDGQQSRGLIYETGRTRPANLV